MYKSMSDTINDIVDCRMIQLEMEWFSLESKQLIELANYCATYFVDLLSPCFYLEWERLGKTVNYETILKENNVGSSCSNHFDFGFDADVISPVVHGAKSFQIYDKKLFSSNSSAVWKQITVSCDYQQTLEKYLPDINGPEKAKDALFSLFYEKGKRMHGLWRNHDALAFFVANKHENCQDLYCGTFTFKIAVGCLNDIAGFSNNLIDFLLGATLITPNINARIALSPIQSPSWCSAHMLYFGGRVPKGYIDSCKELVGPYLHHYCHIYGTEWFNLLSPMVTSRLFDFAPSNTTFADIKVARLGNGNTTVRSTCGIEKVDVCDLANLRRYLYPVLYPGSCKIPLAKLNDTRALGYLAKPRRQWELLPLLHEEITIEHDAIYLSYKTGDGFLP